MPRNITSHIVNPVNDQIVLTVLDEPGAGGANHHYRMEWNAKGFIDPQSMRQVLEIGFQNGPINENGVNGITQEVLLAIIIDRLQSFQKGPYACRENAIALTKLEEAAMWLHKRTRDRMARNVEGTMTV